MRWGQPKTLVGLVALAFTVVGVGVVFVGGRNPTGCEPTRRVEVLGLWTGDEQTHFQRVLDEFEQTSDIDVRYTATADREIAKELDLKLKSGTPVDVAILPQAGALQTLAREGRLLPIDDLRKEVTTNFGEDWVERGEVQGTLYGVWFKANNKSTIWYNKRNFDGQVPSGDSNTWRALLSQAERFAAAGKTPFSIAGADTDAWVLTDWFENVYLRTAGVENYKKLSEHKIPWTDDTVIQALEALAEIFRKPLWPEGGIDGVLATGYPTSVHRVFHTPSTAKMVYEGDFVTAFIPADVMTDAEFFDFPDFPGTLGAREERHVIVGGNVAVLPKPGPGQKENCGARELIRALTTAETVAPWADLVNGGFSSANDFVVPKLRSKPVARAAEQLQKRPIVFDLSDEQTTAFGSTKDKGMYRVLRAFVRDPSNVKATAKSLEDAWQDSS